MKKFTQEIKDKWLEALKSGNYKQGYGKLETRVDNQTRHCCIGVLQEVHPEDWAYLFLEDTIGKEKTTELWETNDEYDPTNLKSKRPKDYKDDYSNVIPLIETLEIQE